MSVDTPEELEGLRRAGALAAEVLREVREAVAPGVSTAELDALAADRMRAAGAHSAPIVTYGFPGAIFTLARGSFFFADGKKIVTSVVRDCLVR